MGSLMTRGFWFYVLKNSWTDKKWSKNHVPVAVGFVFEVDTPKTSKSSDDSSITPIHP